MSENLKVNANSSVLEHKRKHNLLVDAVPQKDTDGNYKIFENIVDSQGHNRFIEGDVDCVEISGVSYSYAKWSLSGSHLMIVVAGTIVNETVIDYRTFARATIPQWIYDKIYPVVGNLITSESFYIYNPTDYSSQNMSVNFGKGDNNTLTLLTTLTATKDRAFRAVFDLLIDNEEPQSETQGE